MLFNIGLLYVETFVRLVIYSLFVLSVMSEYISTGRDFLCLFEGYDEGAKEV